LALSPARKILVRVANLIRLAIDRESDMLLCDHLCRLIGWMVSDLVRSRATLAAEITLRWEFLLVADRAVHHQNNER